MKKITLVIPVYNEADSLQSLYDRLCRVIDSITNHTFEVLFVNDGSRDKSLSLIHTIATDDARVHFVSLARNFGKEAAMLAGLDHASGDAVIILDADLQDPPELIPDMIAAWHEGYDDVYAKRRTRQGDSFSKRFTAGIFYKLLARLTHIEIQQNTGDYRLLSQDAVLALRRLRESNRYTKGMFSWVGFRKKELLFDREPRVAGSGKWSYFKLFNLAIDGITAFTTAPLRLASLLGCVISLASFIYILVIVIQTLLYGSDLAGYPSLMAVILFLGGVQLLSLGIIGEYIARIFVETKQRPVYIVQELHGVSHVEASRHSN